MHDQKKHLKQIFPVQDVQSHPGACMVSQLGEADDDTVTISSLNNLTQPDTSNLGTVHITVLVSVTSEIPQHLFLWICLISEPDLTWMQKAYK